MEPTSTQRTLVAGLAGGLVLNLIDTPWSVLVMVPRLQDFNAAHQLVASPLAGPAFLVAHFALMLGVAWVYAMARRTGRPGAATALRVGVVFLLVNRAFGVGNVMLGWLPWNGFLGFSVSFVVGVLLGSLVVARVVERRSSTPQP